MTTGVKKSLGAKTIAIPTPAWVIGSYDTNGKPNIMTAAWTGICCSKPPCIYVSLRKATYTYKNLMERKAFTVNIPTQKYIKQVDYVGLVSGREVDKFAITELSPVKSELVDAPYVEEFPLVLECRVIQIVEIGLHTQFIGEIMDVKANNSVLKKDLLDITKVQPIIFSAGSRTYYRVGRRLGKTFSIGKKIGKGKKAKPN
jgi:flavin reductase (DIM6/NTAB) family NADH-FMN oxidoreductase RutF